jgi:hypothetical protein
MNAGTIQSCSAKNLSALRYRWLNERTDAVDDEVRPRTDCKDTVTTEWG